MLIFFLEENTEDTHLFFPWKEDSFRQSNIIYFFVGNQRAPQFFLGKKCWFFSWKKMLKTLIYFFLGKKSIFFLEKNVDFFLERKCWRHSSISFSWKQKLIFFLEENTEDTHLFFLWKEDSFRQSNIIYFYLERKCWRHSSIFFLEKNVDFFSWKKMLKTLIYFFLGKKWWFFSLKKNDEDTHLFFSCKEDCFPPWRQFFLSSYPPSPETKNKKRS